MFGFVTITRHKGQAKRQKGQSGTRKEIITFFNNCNFVIKWKSATFAPTTQLTTFYQ